MSNIISIKQFSPSLTGFLFYVTCISLLSFSLPFFWDATYHAEIADWQLTHGIFNWDIPPNIDAGHPPLWGSTIALIWSFTAKSLAPVHLLLFANNLAAAYLFYRVSTIFLTGNYLSLSLFLFSIDTTIVAQLTSLNPDPVMLTLTLWAVYFILQKKENILFVPLILLSLLNIRGWFIAFALLNCNLFFNRSLQKTITQGIIVGCVIVAWCWFHYTSKGSILSSPASAWAHQPVSPAIVLRNTLLVIWRLLDFGRIGIWISISILSYNYFLKTQQKISFQDPVVRLLSIIIIMLACFTIAFVPFSNPIGHRYFLPVIVLSYILFPALLKNFPSVIPKKIILTSSIALLLSGSFWIYPNSIAKGWDSNCLYAAYPTLDKEMREELRQRFIRPEEVYTRHPLSTSRAFSFLDGEPDYAVFKNEAPMDFNYLLYSNLSNGYSDEELEAIESNRWTRLTTKKIAGLELILYQKNRANSH